MAKLSEIALSDTEQTELSPSERRSRNWLLALFIFLIVFATVVLLCGVLSLVFPDSGIPFLWMAFPIGPQPVPLP